ncbi:MAG: glycosyltransferase family 4 protein [Planctomycetales bacterium]|nr:glycosyltransferase family 4 protein [Planctomycetales bacterium]
MISRKPLVSGLKATLNDVPYPQTSNNAFERIVPVPHTRGGSAKKRLLWIGDAVVHTGFATVTHAILEHLHRSWDVVVSGINYEGETHAYPYRIVPARRRRDMWGIDSFGELCQEFRPDIVLINNDAWNVAEFADLAGAVPIVAYIPVDGRNLNRRYMHRLNRLAAVVWYTKFGESEAREAGYRGRSYVTPHGVDLERFQPVPRDVARRYLGWTDVLVPENAFVVGNVNRNQPRKRLDLTVQYFAEWIHENNVRDAYLCFHCAQDDVGWDLRQLAEFYGMADRLLFSRPASGFEVFAPDAMQYVYSAFDVQVSTTLGEGWGLTHMEGMACGVPQIVPDWAALGEWPRGVIRIPCGNWQSHPGINTIGGVPDKRPFVDALQHLYSHRDARRKLAQQGRACVTQSRYRWQNIARKFDRVLCGQLKSNATRMEV